MHIDIGMGDINHGGSVAAEYRPGAMMMCVVVVVIANLI